MFKAVISNSLVTLVVFTASFLFKAYLTHKVAPSALISFYVFSDFIALVMRGFVGYKDCLVKLKQNNDEEEVDLFFIQFKLSVVIITAFILLPIYHLFFSNELSSHVSYFYTAPAAISTIIGAYFLVRVTIEGEYLIMTISEVVKFLTYAVFLFSLLYVIEDLDAMYVAFTLSNLAVIAFVFIKSKHVDWSNINRSFNKNVMFRMKNIRYYKQIFSSSLPYFIQGLFLFLPVYFLVNFGEKEELANYQVVVRSFYFAMLAVFVYPLNRILLQEVFKFFNNKDWAMIIDVGRKVMLAALIVLVFGSPVCYYILPLIIPLLFDVYYNQSALIITVVFFAIPMQLIAGYTTTLIKAMVGFNVVSYIYLVGIASMLIFALILHPLKYWVHYSFLMSNFVLLVASVVVCIHYFNKSMKC